jgi:curved DNA-binding protein CbpA
VFDRDFSDTLEKGKPTNPQKIQITDQEEKECNTLFRRIATRTHPDKLNNDSEIGRRDKKRLEELYKKSNDASEEGDYDTLVKVAGELGFEDVTETDFSK